MIKFVILYIRGCFMSEYKASLAPTTTLPKLQLLSKATSQLSNKDLWDNPTIMMQILMTLMTSTNQISHNNSNRSSEQWQKSLNCEKYLQTSWAYGRKSQNSSDHCQTNIWFCMPHDVLKEITFPSLQHVLNYPNSCISACYSTWIAPNLMSNYCTNQTGVKCHIIWTNQSTNASLRYTLATLPAHHIAHNLGILFNYITY